MVWLVNPKEKELLDTDPKILLVVVLGAIPKLLLGEEAKAKPVVALLAVVVLSVGVDVAGVAAVAWMVPAAAAVPKPVVENPPPKPAKDPKTLNGPEVEAVVVVVAVGMLGVA